MKPSMCALLVLTAAIAGQGCTGPDKVPWEHQTVKAPAPMPAPVPVARAPITEHDVNESDPFAAVRRVHAECDLDGREPTLPPAPAAEQR